MSETNTDGLEGAVRPVIEPILSSLELELYDLQTAPQTLRVLVDAPGGVTSDDLARATRIISRRLDEDDPMPGRYTLEVSSPGIERPLRTVRHFLAAIGESITLKCAPTVEGDRRVSGTLTAADDHAVTVTLDPPSQGQRTLEYADIAKARTTFSWDATVPSTRKASRT